MNVKYNKDGTVSISRMSKNVYYAIQSVLSSAERTFEWDEQEEEWSSNSDFLCSLSAEEKEALDKINWFV